MVNEYQHSGLSNNNDDDDGCSVLAAYRRAYGPGRLAWSKGRRPPGAVATFIACTIRTLVIGFLCYGALEIVGDIIIIIIIRLHPQKSPETPQTILQQEFLEAGCHC